MDRVMLTAFAMLAAGLMLAGVWAFVAYGSSFEVIQDRVTSWVQNFL